MTGSLNEVPPGTSQMDCNASANHLKTLPQDRFSGMASIHSHVQATGPQIRPETRASNGFDRRTVTSSDQHQQMKSRQRGDHSRPYLLLADKIAVAPEVFGFRKGQTGGHTARSMMLSELELVCRYTPTEAAREYYDRAILDQNILNKSTESSRVKSLRHLRELYTLDPEFTLFRVLRRLAALDSASLPLLGLTCTFCRDAQLRHSYDLIKNLKPGEVLLRETVENHLESGFPGRFSAAMKKSLAQNVNTTWTFAGHLEGRGKKVRRLPECRALAAAYAI